MDVVFVNGTANQQGVVRGAFDSLLHLDLDRFPVDVEVEFVADPTPQEHNEFAATTITPGEVIEVKFRSDFPSFRPEYPWGSMAFAEETAVHELGHVLLGILSDDLQEELAEMFGTTPENWSPNTAWEDRPIEGIVETFKDAFMSQERREFANRTNHKLPIWQYPRFRAIFRRAFEVEHEVGIVNPTCPQIPPVDDIVTIPEYDLQLEDGGDGLSNPDLSPFPGTWPGFFNVPGFRHFDGFVYGWESSSEESFYWWLDDPESLDVSFTADPVAFAAAFSSIAEGPPPVGGVMGDVLAAYISFRVNFTNECTGATAFREVRWQLRTDQAENIIGWEYFTSAGQSGWGFSPGPIHYTAPANPFDWPTEVEMLIHPIALGSEGAEQAALYTVSMELRAAYDDQPAANGDPATDTYPPSPTLANVLTMVPSVPFDQAEREISLVTEEGIEVPGEGPIPVSEVGGGASVRGTRIKRVPVSGQRI